MPNRITKLMKINKSVFKEIEFMEKAMNTHIDPVTFYIDRKRPQDYVDVTALSSNTSGISGGNISMFLDSFPPGSNIADGGGTLS